MAKHRKNGSRYDFPETGHEKIDILVNYFCKTSSTLGHEQIRAIFNACRYLDKYDWDAEKAAEEHQKRWHEIVYRPK